MAIYKELVYKMDKSVSDIIYNIGVALGGDEETARGLLTAYITGGKICLAGDRKAAAEAVSALCVYTGDDSAAERFVDGKRRNEAMAAFYLDGISEDGKDKSEENTRRTRLPQKKSPDAAGQIVSDDGVSDITGSNSDGEQLFADDDSDIFEDVRPEDGTPPDLESMEDFVEFVYSHTAVLRYQEEIGRRIAGSANLQAVGHFAVKSSADSSKSVKRNVSTASAGFGSHLKGAGASVNTDAAKRAFVWLRGIRRMSCAAALLEGRTFVLPKDVDSVVTAVTYGLYELSAQAAAEGYNFIKELQRITDSVKDPDEKEQI